MNDGPGHHRPPSVDAVGSRSRMLRELREAPAAPGELRDRLDVSRSTVTRALRRLESLGLVERREGVYRTTLTGRLLLEEYESVVETAGAVAEASDFLDHLPPDAPIATRLLLEGDLVSAGPPDGSAPGRRMLEIVETADAFRGLTRIHATARSSDAYRERLEAGADVEMVYDTAMFESVLDLDDWFGPAIAAGEVVVHVADGIPYGLFLVEDGDDRTTCLLAYDDGALAGVVVSEDPEVWDWATAVFERYRDAADRVDPDQVHRYLGE